MGCALDNTRKLVIHWLGVSLITAGVLLNAASAQEQSAPSWLADLYIAVPVDWREVSSSARVEAFEILADRTQANYEKLRTWEGSFNVEMREFLPAEYARTYLPDNPTAFWKESSFIMRFAIDMESGSIYRSRTLIDFDWVDTSGESIKVPNMTPAAERSIVTAEHYLHFDPEVIWPGFTYLQGWPDAQRKRAAFRESSESVEGDSFGLLMDPREFFGTTPPFRFDNELRMYLAAMKGDMGPDAQRKFDELARVYEAGESGHKWYRWDQTFLDSADEPSSYMTAIFCPTTGHNQVSFTLSADEARQKPYRTMQWDWKRFDDVYMPSKVRVRIYSHEPGELSYERAAELEECTVNAPLEPHQFDYLGLGLNDGDLIVDKIESAMYIMEDGDVKKLADFGETFVPGESSKSNHWPMIIAVNICFAMLLAFFYWRQRTRRSA